MPTRRQFLQAVAALPLVGKVVPAAWLDEKSIRSDELGVRRLADVDPIVGAFYEPFLTDADAEYEDAEDPVLTFLSAVRHERWALAQGLHPHTGMALSPEALREAKLASGSTQPTSQRPSEAVPPLS